MKQSAARPQGADAAFRLPAERRGPSAERLSRQLPLPFIVNSPCLSTLHPMTTAEHPALLPSDRRRVRLLALGLVVAEPGRCVQCGICSHNCPMGIDVRAVGREGTAVTDRRCTLCGSCVARCPRGTLRFELLGRDA